MELYETHGNPIPPEAIVSAVRTQDGLTLRVARWSARQAKGAVTIAIGRSEFIEQYSEVITALLRRKLDVIVFDWRGQGQSDREITRSRRGYVSDFRAYQLDLEAVESQIMRPFATRPWFGFGHSMGAAILLDQAHDGASPFERLVFSAPMIDLPLRFKPTKRRVLLSLDRLGFGARLIPGGREMSILVRRSFEDNILTADPRQFQRLATTMTQLPDLAVGSPTIRWIAGALRMMARFADPRYAVETLTPILVVAAGADRIVDTAAVERFAIRLKAGRCITIPNSRHQLIMERDAVTAQFWAAFDAFIPGHAHGAAERADASRVVLG